MHGVILRSAFTVLVLSLSLAGAAPLAAAPPEGIQGHARWPRTSRTRRRTSIRTSSTAGASPAARPARGGSRTTAPTSRRSTSATARSWLSSSRRRRPDRARCSRGRAQLPRAPRHDAGPARFIFVNEDGQISAWNAAVHATDAVVAADLRRRDLQGARDRPAPAGDRALRGRLPQRARRCLRRRVERRTAAGSFVDPELPAGYAPFGIQTIAGRIFVSYAKQDEDAEDELAGQGLGFVDAYDLDGNLIGRVAHARAARRAVGARAGARRRSAVSGATCSSATSATARSTPMKRSSRASSSTGARSAT